MEGARQALSAARSALQALKAVEKKRQQKVPPLLYHPHLNCCSGDSESTVLYSPALFSCCVCGECACLNCCLADNDDICWWLPVADISFITTV